MAEMGKLQIRYVDKGRALVMLLDAPLGADESTVLLHILSSYDGLRIGVDVNWTATGVERLRPQVEALGITDVSWRYL